MKIRLNDLLKTIEATGKRGVNVIALINRFGVEQGLRVDKVKEYVKMLENGGYVVERNNRLYKFETEV